MSVAISIENVSKLYRLGTIGAQTLRDDLSRWWARTRKSPDPLAKVNHASGNGNEIWALRDVSFDVERGEAVGIIGRNGAGKSTLLKILARITTPTSGRIRMSGRLASLLEVGTGFHPELTGRENILLSGSILGMSKNEIHKNFDEIIAFSGVEKFIDTPVKRYSSGMYVRLAFAVAAHLNPDILLVDEVLAVGDTQFQKKCLGKMNEVTSHGRTVIFVSHNMGAIQRICSRAVFLESGKIHAVGEAKNITNLYLDSVSNQSTYWERTETPSTKVFFTKVYLTNGTEERLQSVTTATPLQVAMEFTIDERLNDIVFGITVSDAEGNSLFSSIPSDSGITIEQKTGKYRYSVQLPQHIFMPRTYTIKAIIWSISSGPLDVVEITFPVYEAASLLNAAPAGRTGALLVVCQWSRN